MTLTLLAEIELLKKFLKKALQEYDGCLYCANAYFENGYLTCDKDNECNKYSLYELDLDKFKKDFDL